MRSHLLLSAVAVASASYSPAFLWAEKDGILGKNAEHMKEVSSVAIERTIASLGNLASEDPELESLIQKSADQAVKEVQLIFVAPGLNTDVVREKGASLQNLKRLMKHSASSLSVPFTTPTLAEFPTMFHDAPRVAAHNIDEFLTTNSHIIANKLTDVLVVALPEGALEVQDDTVGRIAAQISKLTKGNYAALLIGSDEHSPNKKRRMLSDAPEAMPKLRITRDLFTALLISFVLFVIFISGFCCLFSLQTPRKFDDVRAHQDAHGAGHAHGN